MSNLTCRYIFLLWCGFCLYARLIIRWTRIESSYPQLDCTVFVAVGRRTYLSLILQSGCNWDYHAYTVGLLSVDVALGFQCCSYGKLDSSSGNRGLKNDHICGTLYIDNFWQDNETPVCGLSHHTYHGYLYCCVHFSIIVFLCLTCLLVFRIFVVWWSLLIYWFSLMIVSHGWSFVLWCHWRLISTACGSPATCLIWCTVALELSGFFASFSLYWWGTCLNQHCLL